jgi:tRNA A37 threonylcarbamoyladenosine dehydratase
LCVCLIPCPAETHQCTTCSQGYTAIGCVTATFGGGGCN